MRSTQSSLEHSVVTYARDSNTEKTFRPRSRFTLYHELLYRCLGCEHFISDWLGKLKPSKLSTGCQNELTGAAVEKATNPGTRFLFFSRLRCSCARLDKTAMLRRLMSVLRENIRLHITVRPGPFKNKRKYNELTGRQKSLSRLDFPFRSSLKHRNTDPRNRNL